MQTLRGVPGREFKASTTGGPFYIDRVRVTVTDEKRWRRGCISVVFAFHWRCLRVVGDYVFVRGLGNCFRGGARSGIGAKWRDGMDKRLPWRHCLLHNLHFFGREFCLELQRAGACQGEESAIRSRQIEVRRRVLGWKSSMHDVTGTSRALGVSELIFALLSFHRSSEPLQKVQFVEVVLCGQTGGFLGLMRFESQRDFLDQVPNLRHPQQHRRNRQAVFVGRRQQC